MQNNKKILVVEDDPGLQKQMKWSFDEFEVFVAGDRKEALKIISKEHPFVVTVDLGLPPDPDGTTEGLATVEQILAAAPNTKVIVVSGNDERSNAVQAVASGAFDFYQKPIDADLLNQIVTRAHHVFELEEDNRRLLSEHINTPMAGMITNSPQMQVVCRRVDKVAPSNATVLLLGDSGTGKEVLARALHAQNPSITGRFVAINCAAIPENLLESELFGYEKGAFTGATKTTEGKIEFAEGGTLFLDEMGELPFPLQAKLLRFLQERVIERIGGREEIPVNVRVICATHQNLEEKIAQKEFREDLFYRINEIPITIPSLKERDGDALLLARYYFDQINKEQAKKLKGFTKDALTAIEVHQWPGNVRELKNRIKRAVIMADGNQITAADLELEIKDKEGDINSFNLRQVREMAERKVINKALHHTNGKISPAAELLGISRPTLYDLMQKLGINI